MIGPTDRGAAGTCVHYLSLTNTRPCRAMVGRLKPRPPQMLKYDPNGRGRPGGELMRAAAQAPTQTRRPNKTKTTEDVVGVAAPAAAAGAGAPGGRLLGTFDTLCEHMASIERLKHPKKCKVKGGRAEL